MTQLKQIYRCPLCGNIVEVIHSGQGQLVCCGQPMELLEEKTNGEGGEKHLPVIESQQEGVKIKVGEVEHPMLENHYIEWIEVIEGEHHFIYFLKPQEKPEIVLPLKNFQSSEIKVRAYCNVHGLWSLTKK